MVYGGQWRIEGNFPRAQVARVHKGGEPRFNLGNPNVHYEVVLGLSTLPTGIWQSKVSVTSSLAWDDDLIGWIRPQAGYGYGDLLFDDVFSFVLPVR